MCMIPKRAGIICNPAITVPKPAGLYPQTCCCQQGRGVIGNNSYAYCLNNPVCRSDSGGAISYGAVAVNDGWGLTNDDIIINDMRLQWIYGGIYGAEATMGYQAETEPWQILPDPSPITLKKGFRNTTTVWTFGDSSKPVSFYGKVRSDNLVMSSVGIKINIAGFTLNISLGLDNIGIGGSIRNGNMTDSIAIKLDISQLKVGFEWSTTVRHDDTDNTQYTNLSVGGWTLAALCILAASGQ